MKINNPQLRQEILRGQPLKLDLGAGANPRPDYYSVDACAHTEPDITADLCERLDDVPDDGVSHLYSRHTFEHLDDLGCIMQEMNRIVARDGVIEIIVPHFSNVYGFSDPTHKRLFGVYSMYYFSPAELQPERKVPCYFPQAMFEVLDIKIEFYRKGFFDRLLAPIMEAFVNRSLRTQEFYERRLASYFHAWQIKYVLRPIKPSHFGTVLQFELAHREPELCAA